MFQKLKLLDITINVEPIDNDKSITTKIIYFLNYFKTKTNVLLGCLAREVGFQLITLMIPLLVIMFPKLH